MAEIRSGRRRPWRNFALLLGLTALLSASGGPENVLLVVNVSSSTSRAITDYYQHRRGVPQRNICTIRTTENEEISRRVFDSEIAGPVRTCLVSRGLRDQVLYIVTTGGVPLKIAGSMGPEGTAAAVDSELTLVYNDLKTQNHPLPGRMTNPFFRQTDVAFAHPAFPIYLVTRLAAYDVETVKKMIDRGMAARNTGRVVLDARSDSDGPGEDWLRNTALLLPADRVVGDATSQPLYGTQQVIGFASWGSNDPNRKRRQTGFGWLPGAVATEYVSTDGRTLRRPPDSWNPGSDWKNPASQFAASPQSLSADFLAEGASGASGHVYEPYLQFTPRPDLLFPAYLSGRNLAESFYLSIPALSWQNIVLGDPLCALAGSGAPGARKR